MLQSFVNDACAGEGEQVSVSALAMGAIQLCAETHNRSMGHVVTADEVPSGERGYFVNPAKEKAQ